MVYIKKSTGFLLKLYYLVLWKSYLKKKNIWEPLSIAKHFRKLIDSNYFNKLTATFKAIDTASLIARPTIKPIATRPSKQKRD